MTDERKQSVVLPNGYLRGHAGQGQEMSVFIHSCIICNFCCDEAGKFNNARVPPDETPSTVS